MPAGKVTFRFSATLSPIQGAFIKTAIFLPAHVVHGLPKGRIRVKGMIKDVTFALAVQHLRDGSRYFSVSAALRKAAAIALGDRFQVSFKVVDPDELDMPEELDAVLQQDDQARKVWEEFTTGYQRSLIHYVTSVKSVDSRIKRSLDLLNRAKSGLLQGQKKKARKD